MAFLDRLFGGGRDRKHAEGIAHLEAGRFGEAVVCLREAAGGRAASAGSLASYHFRQALLAEGRRLLRTSDSGEAAALFREGIDLWDRYPDLHCLHGVAVGVGGDWDGALVAARTALRLNPDYIEARLLEATALASLERPREAADSLNALLESGRRVPHWLLGRLAAPDGHTAETLPNGLSALLVEAVGGQSEKEEVAAAVALCRAGRWEEGLDRFAELVARQPRYPDYRTRHAAALFQLGRSDEALAEVERALALNEDYRLASDLKALILADRGEVSAAAAYLSGVDTRGAENTGSAHEELFGAYLRGVLALLSGRPGETRKMLGDWSNLVRTFARAELLLAAADDLSAAPAACRERLAALAAEWAGESVYTWLLACHLLGVGRYEEVAAVLARWPTSTDGAGPDWRPLYLEGHLAVCQGRAPALPEHPVTTPVDTAGEGGRALIGPDAWAFLRARTAFLQGNDQLCWETCRSLSATGAVTERLLKLRATAALDADGAEAETTPATPPLPDSCLAPLVTLSRRRDPARADALLEAHARLHPEDPRVCWLSPSFWLGPVRGWIA